MDEREPHRPNYAELKSAPEQDAGQQQEQQAERQPMRPEIIRAPGWDGRGDMVSENIAAGKKFEYDQKIAQQQEQKPDWQRMLKEPEYLREVQQQFKEQQAQMLQRQGPGDDGHNP